ncbi:MAG: succinate dehydrogenase cytochrome b subunit [Chthoniobacteraceae bacterium]
MISTFYKSSIGKKWIVGITGLILLLFVIGHLIGNLQIFLGQEVFDKYAAFLQGLGDLLWAVRIFLIAAFVTHIVTTILLVIQNRKARPERYAVNHYKRSTLASRTMAISGLIVLCFVIVHLADFTFMKTHPEYRTMVDPQGLHNAYGMVIAAFQQPLISIFYIVGVFLLCLHLSHGIQSFFQTLGLSSKYLTPKLVTGGRVVAWAIFAGYAIIPLAVLLHLKS